MSNKHYIYIYSTIPHLPKYEISSLLPSSVAVQPGLCQLRYEHFICLLHLQKPMLRSAAFLMQANQCLIILFCYLLSIVESLVFLSWKFQLALLGSVGVEPMVRNIYNQNKINGLSHPNQMGESILI